MHQPDALCGVGVGRCLHWVALPILPATLPSRARSNLLEPVAAYLPQASRCPGTATHRTATTFLAASSLAGPPAGGSGRLPRHSLSWVSPKNKKELRRNTPQRGTTTFHVYATVCVVLAGWRYTLALTWVRDKESPTTILQRLWKQLESSGIRCKLVLLDRYFFNVQVMKWLQQHELPFIIPVVMRGRKPKKGKAAKGLRAYRQKKAGAYAYTHAHGTESVSLTLVVNYKSYRHARTQERKQKKWLFATWKIRRTPTEIRETYRRRFGIETSYRQLTQARARTTTRDPLYRLFLVGLALLLRNLWQWLTYLAEQKRKRQRRQDDALTALPRFKDILHAFALVLSQLDDHSPDPGTT